MKLSPIIAQLRAYCPSFEGRVFGVADPEILYDDDETMPDLPAVYVAPIDDETKIDATVVGRVELILYERVAIIVAVAQDGKGTGHAAFDAIHDLRAEIFGAVLAWHSTPESGLLAYEGSEVLDMNRERLLVQFDFVGMLKITGESDGFNPERDDLQTASFRIDAIDPADPNLSTPGPDGRTEIGGDVTVNPD